MALDHRKILHKYVIYALQYIAYINNHYSAILIWMNYDFNNAWQRNPQRKLSVRFFSSFSFRVTWQVLGVCQRICIWYFYFCDYYQVMYWSVWTSTASPGFLSPLSPSKTLPTVWHSCVRMWPMSSEWEPRMPWVCRSHPLPQSPSCVDINWVRCPVEN